MYDYICIVRQLQADACASEREPWDAEEPPCLTKTIILHIYISCPRGDRKFGGCCFLGCLGGEFCVSLSPCLTKTI